MGHYCHICGRVRPNESFSGKGHRRHICKRCQRLPKAERQAIEDADHICGMLRQKNISDKNVAFLEQALESPNKNVARKAGLVLEVARIKRHKKKRNRILLKHHKDLFKAILEEGIAPDYWYEDQMHYEECCEAEWDEYASGLKAQGDVMQDKVIIDGVVGYFEWDTAAEEPIFIASEEALDQTEQSDQSDSYEIPF